MTSNLVALARGELRSTAGSIPLATSGGALPHARYWARQAAGPGNEGGPALEHHEPHGGLPHDDSDARSRLMSNRRARRLRRFWRMLPSAPRCKICTSPFGPPVGPVLRLVGKGRWPGNPKYCSGCFKDLYRHREGAEVECTLFFADVRGSTRLAESMP